MSSVAIITARGGSKRIPKKNIKDFCGKPIIAYSIEAALNSGAFDTVMVSTDSQEIADVSETIGAEIPFYRSKETSDDFATTTDVIKEVLNVYKNMGRIFDSFCCIYPTAPFVTSDRLLEASKLLLQSDAYSVMTVVKYSFPPQRSLVLRDGYINYLNPENASRRSQDLEPLYHDAGQFYFCKTKDFMREESIITSKTIPFELQEFEVQDIDNVSDWILAEMKYKMLVKQ